MKMKIVATISTLVLTAVLLSFTFSKTSGYGDLYRQRLNLFTNAQQQLRTDILRTDLADSSQVATLRSNIHKNRTSLKQLDFWFRWFEPVAYRKINGPLPVEWETEVFEKFEPPYRREGGGLILAELQLDEEVPNRDTLLALVDSSLVALNTFAADSITSQLDERTHFFFCNRLFLLNLAALYTTGFECPDTSLVIPEMQAMLESAVDIYKTFNQAFPESGLNKDYMGGFERAIQFTRAQPKYYGSFDHYTFIRNHINPLFRLNQRMIREYDLYSANYNDYALSNEASSIFDKSLFMSQNTKGIFSLTEDEAALEEIKRLGKQLFYDPILSSDNKRSCASCHRPDQYFTDTTQATSFMFDQVSHLPRNTPSLINSVFNHLVMLDGKHISLQGQAREVILNHHEMNSVEPDLLRKVLSCSTYKNGFKKLLKFTPEEKKVTLTHVVSAITYYYADFSNYYSPFDEAMNEGKPLQKDVVAGFNLFMSKAQCATCHFVPHFNGIKPPYIGSEFEVLGVPADTAYSKLSDDQGRFVVNPAHEMLNAFRTGTIRNIQHTAPYMHNGVFKTLEEVVEFYDAGGGIGRKLDVPNQTLSDAPLKLSAEEKKQLIAFMHSLNETIIFDSPPASLPASSDKKLNNRKIGGEY